MNMTMTKKNTIEHNRAEYGVDSRYLSKKEQESDSLVLMQARLDRMRNVSQKDIVRAKLLQLKLKMERHLEDSTVDNRNSFTEFLKTYIDTIYSKRIQFAEDMNVRPVLLSQIINNHRDPHDEFIQKLMIHSEKAFNSVCEFPVKIWYQIYYDEKIGVAMSNESEWRPNLEKNIKISRTI